MVSLCTALCCAPASPNNPTQPPAWFSYATVDDFLWDVRRLCANSFLYSRETSNDIVLSFLRKLDTDEVKRVLTPSKPLVPKWEKCLEVGPFFFVMYHSIFESIRHISHHRLGH